MGVTLIGAGELRADKFKATLRSVDPEKRTISVTMDSTMGARDRDYSVAQQARIIRGNGQKPLTEGLKDPMFKRGASVTLTILTEQGRDTVVKIAVYGQKKGG